MLRMNEDELKVKRIEGHLIGWERNRCGTGNGTGIDVQNQNLSQNHYAPKR